MRDAPSISIAGVVLVALASCAAPEGPGGAGGPGRSPAEPTMVQGSQRELLRQFTNVENGLEVRRWIVDDDSDLIGAALTTHARPTRFSPGVHDLLRRNGLRLVAVPIDRLDDLNQQFSPMALDLTEWHGQVLQWRDLHERPVSAAGRVVAIEGRVRRFEQGRFQLLVRCWPVPMEDGAYMQLDMVPFFETGRRTHADLLPASPARQGELLEALSLQLQLEDGFAYVLVGESPEVLWPGEDASASGGAPSTARSRRRGPAIAPPSGLGPGAGAPATLGMILLSDRTQPPTRGMLIFVPKIGRDQYPPLGG